MRTRRPEDIALAGASVYSHRFIGEDLRQFGSNPLRRVVILAENDAAMLQPGLTLGAMHCEEICNSRQLRVTGFGAYKFLLQDVPRSSFSAVDLPEAKLEQMRWSKSVFINPAALVRCWRAMVKPSAA